MERVPSGKMKFVEMENGQAWQQLISRSHGLNPSAAGGGAGDSDYDTPSNQVRKAPVTVGHRFTKVIRVSRQPQA